MNVIDAAVTWWHGYMNTPTLDFLLDEKPGEYADLRWHLFPMPDGARFLVSVNEPMVHFMREAPGGGGAYGAERILVNGQKVTTRGGWSSNDARVNTLREEDARFAAVLPHSIIEVSYHVGTWADVGLAGVGWFQPFVEEQVERYLPGVTLYPQAMHADDDASAEQSAVIYAGLAMAGVGDTRPRGVGWVPWPTDQPGEKPAVDSALYRTTDAHLKYQSARRLPTP